MSRSKSVRAATRQELEDRTGGEESPSSSRSHTSSRRPDAKDGKESKERERGGERDRDRDRDREHRTDRPEKVSSSGSRDRDAGRADRDKDRERDKERESSRDKGDKDRDRDRERDRDRDHSRDDEPRKEKSSVDKSARPATEETARLNSKIQQLKQDASERELDIKVRTPTGQRASCAACAARAMAASEERTLWLTCIGRI